MGIAQPRLKDDLLLHPGSEGSRGIMSRVSKLEAQRRPRRSYMSSTMIRQSAKL